jgi:hypothetical protein
MLVMRGPPRAPVSSGRFPDRRYQNQDHPDVRVAEIVFRFCANSQIFCVRVERLGELIIDESEKAVFELGIGWVALSGEFGRACRCYFRICAVRTGAGPAQTGHGAVSPLRTTTGRCADGDGHVAVHF